MTVVTLYGDPSDFYSNITLGRMLSVAASGRVFDIAAKVEGRANAWRDIS